MSGMQSSQASAPDLRPAGPAKPSLGRITLFASGDFACNLYWQSLSFFLLFFYTDALRLSPAVAGLVLLIGSVWDGIADLLVGIHAERSRRDYRWFLSAGAVPLGLGFVLLYVAPPLEGAALVVTVLTMHLLFRALYAFVNIPYSAMTARITGDSGQRALISGLRMLFGTAAALRQTLREITGHAPLTTLQEVEPLGPQQLAEALVIAPATGTTMALLAAGVSSTPVTLAAASDTRKAAASAMSSAETTRRSGDRLCRTCQPPASIRLLVAGVGTVPGARALTRIPSGPNSIACCRVSASSAPLIAV